MISVENLSKFFGSVKAVNGISFEVPNGEILGFLGPNGAGKTTTMRILACYIAPTEGDVKIDGLDILEDNLEIRRKIGYLPENAPVYRDMNVIDYLSWVADLRNLTDKKNMRMKKMVDICGLGDVLSQSIETLSKGYRQRVGLAQAMIHDPEILILDEPTSGLDPNQIVEIRNLIREIGKEKTILLSTHILPEVQATCNRVLIIDKGKLVADGTPQELQESFEGGVRIHLELQASEAAEDIEKILSQIDAIKEIHLKANTEDNLYQLEIFCNKNTDPRSEIFHLIVKQNWILLEMRRIETSLEDIFHQITKS